MVVLGSTTRTVRMSVMGARKILRITVPSTRSIGRKQAQLGVQIHALKHAASNPGFGDKHGENAAQQHPMLEVEFLV